MNVKLVLSHVGFLVNCWIGAIGIRHRQGHKNPTLEIRPPRFKKKLWFGTYKQPRDVLRARDAALFYMGFLNDLVFPDSQARFSKLNLGIQFGDLDPECTSIVNIGGKNVKKHTYFAKEVKRVIRIVLSGKDKSSPELLPQQQQPQPPQTPDSCNTWGSHPLSEEIDPDVCLIDPSSIRPIYTPSPSEWQLTDTICDSSPTFSEDLASSSLPHNSPPNSLLIASPTQDVSSSIAGTYGLVQNDLCHYQFTPLSHCNITSAVTSESVFPNDGIPVDWALQEIYNPNFDSWFLNPNFGITFLPDSDMPCDFGGGGLIGPMLGDHCDMGDEEWRYAQSYLFPLWTSYFLHYHEQRSTCKAVTAAIGALSSECDTMQCFLNSATMIKRVKLHMIHTAIPRWSPLEFAKGNFYTWKVPGPASSETMTCQSRGPQELGVTFFP